MKRVLNKVARLKSEFAFNNWPKSTEFVKSKENKILMYHGVDLNGKNEFNTRHVPKDYFEKQVSFLKKNCNIISLADFFEKKFDPNKTNVAITFDDGYLNNYTIAKPILEKYQAPATFFITGINETEDDILWSDFVDIISALHPDGFSLEKHNFSIKNGVYYSENGSSIYEIIQNEIPDYKYKQELFSRLKQASDFKSSDKYDLHWKLMTNEQIIETSKSEFITIGSHGFYHNDLGKIDFESASMELDSSKKYLENPIQKEIDSIGYPNSSYSREVLEYAFSLGFKYQVATENYQFEEDILDTRILTRKGIYNCDTPGNQLFI